MKKWFKELTYDGDPVIMLIMVLMAAMLLTLIVVGTLTACGVLDSHPGQVCIQKTLTHHVKLGNEWDCTKWGQEP